MKKYFLALLLAPLSASAADLYHYNPIEGCSLRKAASGSWQVVQPSEVGQDSFTIIPSKANASFSNFKYQGVWYAAKTECFQLSEAPAGEAESVASVGSGFKIQKGKIFIEPKFSYYFMAGTGTGGGTVSGTTVEKYKPSIALAVKGGYYLNDHSDLYLELATFSGKRHAAAVGNVEDIDDSIFSINVGYQYFIHMKSALLPYVAVGLGYNKLTQKLTSTNLSYEGSGSSIGFVLEGGALYELSKNFALTGALNYTTTSVGTLKTTSNVEISNEISYSRVGINIGVRYNF